MPPGKAVRMPPGTACWFRKRMKGNIGPGYIPEKSTGTDKLQVL